VIDGGAAETQSAGGGSFSLGSFAGTVHGVECSHNSAHAELLQAIFQVLRSTA
jgi:hypothetical protein